MPINYKDINELTEQTTIAGTEKVPVSGTKYVLFNKIKDWIINSLKTTGLDLGGKQIKNVAIDVVTTLPTTNIVGRRVTYQGRDYIWNGSAWKNDSDYWEIGGRNLVTDSKTRTRGSGSGFMTAYEITDAMPSTEETYTISFDFTASTRAGAGIGFGYSNIYDGSYFWLPPMDINVGHYEKTLKLIRGDYTHICFYVNTATTVTNFKIEKGNKATDWTPAPEDKADVNHNHDSTYLGITEKSADSDKLDGKHASDFADVDHNHDTYLNSDATAVNSDKLDGYHSSDFVQYIVDSPLTHKYIQFDTITSFGWKSGAGLIIALYQDSGTNSFGDYHSYDCMELFGCNYSTPNKTDIFEGGVYPNPTDNAKIAKRNIWTDSPDVIKYKHKLTEGIFGSFGNAPANSNLTDWLNASYNGISGHALKNSSSFFTDLPSGTTYSLNLIQLNPNLKMGMNYTFVGRAVYGQTILNLTDIRDTAVIKILENQIMSFDFVKVANGVIIYRNLEVR